jgi:hypothetical protein
MAPCFGWDSFWGVITQRLCLLSSDGRWNTVYASWTSVLFDRSLVRSKWNTTRSPCCGFCFTFRLRWIETQSYATIYAPILGDELVLAFAEARRRSPRPAPWRRRLAPQRRRAVSFFPFFFRRSVIEFEAGERPRVEEIAGARARWSLGAITAVRLGWSLEEIIL